MRPEVTVSVRLTIPAKRFTPVTVIVAVAEVPTLAGLGELAVIVKLRNWKNEVAMWTSDPLVPVNVSV
jgi:hypothetical protein